MVLRFFFTKILWSGNNQINQQDWELEIRSVSVLVFR